jgi:phage terminase Nu1 subunit (DNA packaging protein)
MTSDVERFPLPDGVADAVLNKSQLARALNVSEPTIDRWIGDGLPVLTAGTNGRSYEFQLSECFAWRKAREAEREAENDAAERAVQEMRLALVGGKAGTTEQALPPRERRELYAAEREWMAMAQARGELVRFDDVVDVLDGALAAVRAALEAMPDRLGRELSLTTPQVLVAVRLADDILDDLSKTLGGFVAKEKAKSERVTA